MDFSTENRFLTASYGESLSDAVQIKSLTARAAVEGMLDVGRSKITEVAA
jgi:hypothetical protein